MAESLHCSPETITTLFVNQHCLLYTNTKSFFFFFNLTNYYIYLWAMTSYWEDKSGKREGQRNVRKIGLRKLKFLTTVR